MNLSIFFPAYNEEGNIEKTVRGALKVLRGLDSIMEFEILIVDDGSTDRTGEIADRLATESPEVRAIHHSQNRGYGGALKTGLYSAQFEWIVFTDSDGQFDFSEVTEFIKLAEGGDAPDLILGYRLDRADSLVRKLNSRLWAVLVRLLFGLRVRDRACGFKMIRRTVVEGIAPLESDGAVAEDELLIRAKRAGFTFAEVGVHHYPRAAGEPTGADPRVILRAFREIFSLWRHLH